MDWNPVTAGAAVVAAVAATIAALLSVISLRLQRFNYLDSRRYQERLQIEERYFKLHLLWQDLRVVAVTLQSLPMSVPDFIPHLEDLPVAQLTEALATKDLLTPEGATRVRIARDDLVLLEQMAGDTRTADTRRLTGFDEKFPEQLAKTLTSVDHARQTVLDQLPT